MALSVTTVIWLTGIHSIIHGIWGIILVQTTHYVNYTPGINYALVVLYALLIMLGISVFCVVVSRLPVCAVIFGVLFALLAVAIIITSIVYSMTYWGFFANSVFDAMLFYTEIECWVCDDHAMTIWHFLTVLMILLTFLWFFYAILLCKYARCVCCIPCPTRACYKPRPCPEQTCCPKETFIRKLFKPKCVAPAPACCPAFPAPCPVPLVCPTTYQQQQQPYQPVPRKGPKFVLSLRPGRYCK